MQVNGVEVPLTVANCEKYLADNNGTASLIDTPAASGGSTDGKYDYISVTYALDAVVDEVTTRSGGVQRVMFDNYDQNIGRAYLDVDPDDDDTAYTITIGGQEISVDELREDDVLSIISDPLAGSIDGSSFVRASVSRSIVEGTVDGIGTDSDGDEYYTINGTQYYLANCCYDTPEMGYSYTAYLDINGDIAKLDQNAASVSYAIVDRFYTNAGDSMVRLITKTGNKVGYTLKSDNSVVTVNGQTGSLETLMGYNKAYTDAAFPIDKRIVSYSVNSSNEVTIKGLVSSIGSGYVINRAEDATYKATNQRIGSYAISDSSIILDASDYSTNPSKSVSVSSVGRFVDEMTYTAVFAGKRSGSDNSYPFVVLINGDNGYTTSSQIAVYSKTQTQMIDGDTRTVLYVYKDGYDSATPLVMDEQYSASELGNLTEGDVILYKVDSDEYVDDVMKIMTMSASDIASNRDALYYSMTPDGMITDEVKNTKFSGKYDVKFVFGPVIKRASSYITLGSSLTYEDGIYTSSEAGETYSYATTSEFKAYQYDGTKSKNMISAGTASTVSQSTIPKIGGYTDDNRTEINWNNDSSIVHWALLRIVDNDVMEVYSIVSKDNASATTSLVPELAATAEETAEPTIEPTATPTAEPTEEPTQSPEPTATPEIVDIPDDEPVTVATPTPTVEATQTPEATIEATPIASEGVSEGQTAEATTEPVPSEEAEPTQASDTTPSSTQVQLPISGIIGNGILDEIIVPILRPTAEPTAEPTVEPTAEPTAAPTAVPTAEPTVAPTAEPTAEPTAAPTVAPTAVPTVAPTAVPTAAPTATPVATVKPTTAPTQVPTQVPSVTPSPTPSATPSASSVIGAIRSLIKPKISISDIFTK
jgi:hypothetical protein